jgi:hypothetical protein
MDTQLKKLNSKMISIRLITKVSLISLLNFS